MSVGNGVAGKDTNNVKGKEPSRQAPAHKIVVVTTRGSMRHYIRQSIEHFDSSDDSTPTLTPLLFRPINEKAINKMIGVVEIVKREYGRPLRQYNFLSRQEDTAIAPALHSGGRDIVTSDNTAPPAITPDVVNMGMVMDDLSQNETQTQSGPRDDDAFRAVVMSEGKRPKKRHFPKFCIALSKHDIRDADLLISPVSTEIWSTTVQEHPTPSNRKTRTKRKRRKTGRDKKQPNNNGKNEDEDNNVDDGTELPGDMDVIRKAAMEASILEEPEWDEEEEDDGTAR